MATATANNNNKVAPVIGDATRIWESGIHWRLNAQCCVWDPVRRVVDVWECICEHKGVPGTSPPNTRFWRFIAKR